MRQELVSRQLEEQIGARFPVGQRLRVLDVGMGRGAQALRLARAGHAVTGLESDPEKMAAARAELAGEPEGIRERVRLIQGEGVDTGVHFKPGAFDVVLCHGVLMHIGEPDALLAGLARMLAPGGLLSLLVRNGDALALRPGRTGDWRAALAAFDGASYTDRLGRTVRADRLADLTRTLDGIAAPLQAWYGVRVFTDGACGRGAATGGVIGTDTGTVIGTDTGTGTGTGTGTVGVAETGTDAEPPTGGELDQLLAAEERAGRTDPYRAVAALLHLCGVRG